MVELHQSMAGSRDKNSTVSSLYDTGYIALCLFLASVECGYFSELVSVECLYAIVHTDKESAIMGLRHTIHIVTKERVGVSLLMLVYFKSVTVIRIKSITGGYPDKAFSVLVDLIDQVAGKVLVTIKPFSRLCLI
jgi:hypothetical protein